MTAENKSYEIRTLNDMLAIPPDRFPAFVAELAEWHAAASKGRELLAAIGLPDPELSLTWCDDGKPGVSEFNVSLKFER